MRIVSPKYLALTFLSFASVSVPFSVSAEAMNPADPADNIEAWVKLEGDTSGRMFFHLGHLVAYGLPAGRFGERLFEMVSISKQAFRKIENGGYETVHRACGLYVDAKTGKFIADFVNPYTDETIKLKPFCSNISGGTYSVENGMSMNASFQMASTLLNKPYVLDWRIVGDQVEIVREAFTEWEEKSTGKTKYEMTLDTYSAKLSELSDPGRTSVDASYNYTLATEWMSMLKMGDRPGSMVWKGTHTKHFDIAELPSDLVAEMKKTFGDDVLDKPLVW